MQTTNGVIYADDIGGPMCISNGYRWNVPVVTYGFDQSFLNYFGSNGVAAVESAIQIVNDLPPASQMVLTNYPLYSQQENYEAAALSLYDLKSKTLSLLLEHLGLAQPTRYIYVIKQWTPALNGMDQTDCGGWAIPEYIVQRNFDPLTLLPTPYVNQTLYTAYVASGTPDNEMIIVQVDPLQITYNAVADFQLNSGWFYTGLTCDDVGGLACLLSTNNINYETLLPGVMGVGTNLNGFVNGAWRPGVDKITFVPQPVGAQSGAFLAMTNNFTDNFFTNGTLESQQMARIISQPDFLFSAGDVTSGNPSAQYYTPSGNTELPYFSRTGTPNWLNNSAANGNTNGAGPGVIQPPVQIVFNKLGPLLYSEGSSSDEQVSVDSWQYWASYDGSTNAPVVYPIPQTGTNQLTVRMWLMRGNYPNGSSQSFVWKPGSLPGAQFTMQTTTNLNDWTTLFAVTNNGSTYTYLNINPASASRFYRLIPQ
jgi:hypothetical protein